MATYCESKQIRIKKAHDGISSEEIKKLHICSTGNGVYKWSGINQKFQFFLHLDMECHNNGEREKKRIVRTTQPCCSNNQINKKKRIKSNVSCRLT